MIVKIKGLVIKAKNINENDKYLTVLCEEYGKISFKAAGVRSFKNKNIVSAQPFVFSEFTLFKAPSFIKMNEAHIIEGFYGIRTDLALLALAVYLSDIASVICVGESEDEGEILKLLLNCLYMMANKKMPPNTIKAVFELRALTKSGFMPGLEECENCSRQNFDEDTGIFFDLIGGNLICGECIGNSGQSEKPEKPEKKEDGSEYREWGESTQRKLVRISSHILNAMRFVTSVKDEKLFSFALQDDAIGELSRVCEKYLLEQLGMNIDSLKYYKSYE
ncbi:MAG: DNA repair protein RecO [Oscillospiraceae bacterium]|nr:DNA repair protein RecO [Oscillospiraceae bacterium]